VTPQVTLENGGKNKVGSIYNNLENLGFLSRLWGDQRYLNVNEGGIKGQSNLQIIKYIDDSTVEEVRSIALDSKMANNVVEYEFEQTYNGKDLREAVLERNTQESVAKSSQALRADNSLISSNSTVSSNGRIEPFKESGDDPANDRSAMLPTEGASSDVETGYSKGTRSEDIFTISPNSKIVSSIDLRKDLSSDTIILGGNGTDTTGHLNIINYDPSRDTLTGELVDSLTWSYDPVYHVVRGVGESAENSSIQQTRERALNGEALLVNIYVPFGRFRNRDGKAVESRSKGYDIQAILDNLNGSDSGPTSSLYSTLTADHLLAANI
jgi:hypothetical protein